MQSSVDLRDPAMARDLRDFIEQRIVAARITPYTYMASRLMPESPVWGKAWTRPLTAMDYETACVQLGARFVTTNKGHYWFERGERFGPHQFRLDCAKRAAKLMNADMSLFVQPVTDHWLLRSEAAAESLMAIDEYCLLDPNGMGWIWCDTGPATQPLILAPALQRLWFDARHDAILNARIEVEHLAHLRRCIASARYTEDGDGIEIPADLGDELQMRLVSIEGRLIA
jgi:hypothetical protein